MVLQRVGLASLDWFRIPSDACGQANSILMRYVWREKYLIPERKPLRIQKYPDTCGRGVEVSLGKTICIIRDTCF